MKVTFDEVSSRKEWIHKELLRSLSGEVIEKVKEKREFDVKLLVDGIVLEPKYLDGFFNKIDQYIIDEARSLLDGQMDDLAFQMGKLEGVVQQAMDSIQDEFDTRSKNLTA